MLFTEREKRVIQMVLKGKERLEIARSLRISENTVKVYRTRIRHKVQKFGIHDVVDLAKLPVLI